MYFTCIVEIGLLLLLGEGLLLVGGSLPGGAGRGGLPFALSLRARSRVILIVLVVLKYNKSLLIY